MRRLLGPTPRFVLTIGNEGALLAYIVDGRVAEVRQIADTTEVSLATLAAALSRRPGRPLVVLIDLLEQSYRQESAPKISRMDRQKVLKRRLERAFPDAALKAAIERGDDPDQRSSKRYLLMAVPAVSDWGRWADFLRAIENRIVALTLLPVEAVSMVARLAHHLAPPDSSPSPWTIFISRQATGGVRQIVVNRGELALTRLTPTLAFATPDDAPELPESGDARPQDPANRPPENDATSGPTALGTFDVAAALQDELRATLGYMTRLGYRAGTGLDIILLGDEGLKRQWEGAIPNGCRLHALTATDAATALGLGRIPDADEGTLLCAVWAARRRHPAVELLPPDLRMRMLQGLALRSASAGLAASAIGLAGYTVFQLVTGLQLGQEVDWLKAWRTTAETRVERAGTEVGDAEPSADTVRSVLEANQRLQSNKLDPIAPLRALRQAMAQGEQLLSVAWQTEGGDDAGRSPRGDDPERQSDDFILDLTFDLGRRADRSAAIAAVEAADRFAARLADSFPERPILIRRQAASILPDESFVGGAGLIAEPVVDGQMSAELRIGRRRR